MSEINDGGSILPAMRSNCGGYGIAPHSDGLTIRDWLAGMALQGLAVGYHDHPNTPKVCASVACELADATLAELRKGDA